MNIERLTNICIDYVTLEFLGSYAAIVALVFSLGHEFRCWFNEHLAWYARHTPRNSSPLCTWGMRFLSWAYRTKWLHAHWHEGMRCTVTASESAPATTLYQPQRRTNHNAALTATLHQPHSCIYHIVTSTATLHIPQHYINHNATSTT